MIFEHIIGLEVHCELSTETKIFCSCSTKFGSEPNTHVCEICSGMPGTLPVLNKQVVEYAIRAGLAVDCEITRFNKFDRKNYFYPDLPKAYQLSQLYMPICRNGHIDIETSGGKKSICIREIHMEEDAGKLIHDPYGNFTFADFNRCGVPLLEIVTEPDFRSAEEVIAYLTKLKTTLQYIGVSDCKMEQGSLRADVNISVRLKGSEKLGTRTEMKNINSFKAIARAIKEETKRQEEIVASGGTVIQETRRWDDAKGESHAMRSKENAQDYRYFPEPDLPPVEISDEWIERVKKELPELPDAKKARYLKEYALPEYDVDIITGTKTLVKVFEEANSICGDPKEVSNWIMGELLRMASETGVSPEDIVFDPAKLAKLIIFVKKGVINRNIAKEVFEKAFTDGVDLEAYIKENGLETVNDEKVIFSAVEKVITDNQKSVAELKEGNSKVMGFLMGCAMRELNGKADPSAVRRILVQELEKIK